jgi:hypothetical protein
VVIGSFLPWATVVTIFGNISKAGTDGDGVLTMLLAGGAAALSLARKAPRAIIVMLALTAVVAVYDIADVARLGGEGEDSVDVSVGFGLWIVAIGAAVAIWGAIQRRRRPSHADDS